MRYVELNPKGNYALWEDYKLSDLVEVDHCYQMGEIIMIIDKIKLFELLLGERFSYMKHPKLYSWPREDGGMAVLANKNGRIVLLVFEEEDFGY